MGRISSILEQNGITENTPLPQEENVVYTLPSKEELDAHIKKNIEANELQNQTHADTCGSCIKWSRTTPNPRSQMGNCQTHGLMTLKNQASCDGYKFTDREDGGLWPS